MHRLIAHVGWPYIVLAAVMLVAAAPTVLRYWRFELRLARRARTFAPRSREGRLYW